MVEAGLILKGLTEIECVCPVHPLTRDPITEVTEGCPGGDCDGCKYCLAGRARRLLSSAREVRG